MREHASTPHSILGILLTTRPLSRAILSVSAARFRKGALRPGAVPAQPELGAHAGALTYAPPMRARCRAGRVVLSESVILWRRSRSKPEITAYLRGLSLSMELRSIVLPISPN